MRTTEMARKAFTSGRHKSAAGNVRGGLEHLIRNANRALDALERGQQLDAHLLTNAAHITYEIGLYNLTLDLAGFEEAEPAGETA